MSDSSCGLSPGSDGRTAWLEERRPSLLLHPHLLSVRLLSLMCVWTMKTSAAASDTPAETLRHFSWSLDELRWKSIWSWRFKFSNDHRGKSPEPPCASTSWWRRRTSQQKHGRERVEKQIHVLLNLWIRIFAPHSSDVWVRIQTFYLTLLSILTVNLLFFTDKNHLINVRYKKEKMGNKLNMLPVCGNLRWGVVVTSPLKRGAD